MCKINIFSAHLQKKCAKNSYNTYNIPIIFQIWRITYIEMLHLGLFHKHNRIISPSYGKWQLLGYSYVLSTRHLVNHPTSRYVPSLFWQRIYLEEEADVLYFLNFICVLSDYMIFYYYLCQKLGVYSWLWTMVRP